MLIIIVHLLWFQTYIQKWTYTVKLFLLLYLLLMLCIACLRCFDVVGWKVIQPVNKFEYWYTSSDDVTWARCKFPSSDCSEYHRHFFPQEEWDWLDFQVSYSGCPGNSVLKECVSVRVYVGNKRKVPPKLLDRDEVFRNIPEPDKGRWVELCCWTYTCLSCIVMYTHERCCLATSTYTSSSCVHVPAVEPRSHLQTVPVHVQ